MTNIGGQPIRQDDLVTIIRDLQSRLVVLERAATQAPAPIDPWHVVGAAGEPAFGTGWSNQYAPGSGPQTRFRKMPSGLVLLAGSAQSTGAGATVLTLPVGYRPSAQGSWPHAFWNGSARITGIISVQTDGQIRVWNNADAAGAMTYVNFDVIRFWAEQ